ncbi:recombinase family protein [Ureibacillus chungkukjangi]|uniref:recombinase family protein n=1 Tax=Ureibacillus chungkukjangi TaxID=1202712 RepID=UPI00203E9275|nr:recombinase family protein [Ureibacillus chungkukjangi]MCM3387176.1 recombinase family protein [Ureibacillus chungkukjangi]
MSRKRSIIYSRKSRNSEGMSHTETLENQRESLVKYANEKGYDVIEVFEEVASSVDEEREQLNAMFNLIKKGEVEIVVVSAIDRIARSVGIFEKFLQICKDYNVIIETPQSQINLSNQGSEILALIQSVLAKSEYGEIKRRLTEGKLNSVQVKKRWIGSTAPFGYKYDKLEKTLVPDEDTQHLYRKMVEFALDGLSFAEVAKKMNDGGFNTIKGNPWSATRIKKILDNRTYLGEAEYNSATLKRTAYATDCHTPLITEQEFNRIRTLASNRNMFRDRSKMGAEKTIIDGLVYCGTCGRKRSIFLQRSTEGRKRKTEFYNIRACHHKNIDGSRCGDGGCKSEYVENTIIDYLKKYSLKLKDEYEKVANSITDDSLKLIKDKIKALNKDVSDNKDSIKRATAAYMRKLMDIDEYETWKKELEDSQKVLLKELEEAENLLSSMDVETIKNGVKDRIDIIDLIINDDKLTIRETNNLLKTIIKRIEVSKKKGVTGKPDKIDVILFNVI